MRSEGQNCNLGQGLTWLGLSHISQGPLGPQVLECQGGCGGGGGEKHKANLEPSV